MSNTGRFGKSVRNRSNAPNGQIPFMDERLVEPRLVVAELRLGDGEVLAVAAR